MHIPDGFLSTPVWATLDVACIPAVGYMARKAQRDLEESKIALLGVMGAFVFAAQMVNFPVGVGASGHLLGGALLAFTIGPAAAGIVMTAVLAIQAFVFQDGGILALGANILNLGVVGVLAGYLPYHFWGHGRFRTAAIFLGGVISVLAGAVLAVGQILLSGVPIQRPLLGISFALFLIAALLEGAITVAVLQAIEKIHPNWVRRPERSNGSIIKAVAAAAVFLAVTAFLFASSSPDTLEKTAERLGISSRGTTLVQTPLADYTASFVAGEWPAKAIAGLFGLLLVYLCCILVGKIIAPARGTGGGRPHPRPTPSSAICRSEDPQRSA